VSNRTTKQKQDLKIKILIGILIAFLIITIGLIFLVINGVNKDSVVKDNSESSPASSSQQVDQISRTLSGKTVEEDKKDAVESIRRIIEEAAKNPSNKPDLMSQVDAIDKAEDGVVTAYLKSMIRTDGFDPITKNIRTVNTLQSLVVVADAVKDEKGKVNLVQDDAWNQAFVDQEAGYALVPLTVFHSTGAFDFHMVYVEGKWEFAPKTFIDDVARFSQQASESQSESSPSS